MSETIDDTAVETPTDTGTTLMELTVSTSDLRNALRAVVVHAGDDKEVTELQRLRFYIRPGNIMIGATNRYTVGLGLVSIWGNTYDDTDAILDVTPRQVSELLTMFRTPKEKDEDAGDDDLRLRITDRFLVVTDIAGLFPGKEVTWPRIVNGESYPDLTKLMGKLVATAGTASAATLHTSGKLLGLFTPAAKVYDSHVVIEPTSETQGALVVTVGESFLGAIMPIKPSDEMLEEQAAWRRAWDDRLGQVDLGTGELDPIVPEATGEPAGPDAAVIPGQTSVEDEVDIDQVVAAAAGLVITTQLGSRSMLQRKLRLGVAEADRVLEQLRDFAVIGPALPGTAPSEVLIPAVWSEKVAAVILDGGSPDDVQVAIGRIPVEPADDEVPAPA